MPVVTRSALSPRGDVQVDARTNTLIIRDLADRLVAAGELIKSLDRPQPQVEIEARIVQLDRDKARDLGIDWGFDGRVDPALGTSTGLAFPNSGISDRRHRRGRPGPAAEQCRRHRARVGEWRAGSERRSSTPSRATAASRCCRHRE